MTALTGAQLLAWLDDTSRRWADLLSQHPEALSLPCDVRESQTVAQVLQHIVAVELRYAERLADQPATDYDRIPYDSVAPLRAVHSQAVELLLPLLEKPDGFWDEPIVFQTRSLGAVQSRRRAVLVHLAMHSVRHYAQLATLVRQHGIKPDWFMDYLFQEAQIVEQSASA